ETARTGKASALPEPSAGNVAHAWSLRLHAGQGRAVRQRRYERINGPGPGRYDRDARRTRGHGRDAREERVHLVTRNEEGDRARQVAPAAGHAEAPPRDARALDEVIREGAERVRAGRARGARRTGALAAVPAAQPQQLHVHLDAPTELAERRADPLGVRREPAVELAGG